MSGKRYYLDLSGRPLEGYRADEVAETLARLLRIPPQRARNLLRGAPSRIQRDLDKERALHLMNKIIACGAQCDITPLESSDADLTESPVAGDEQPDLLELELEAIESGDVSTPVEAESKQVQRTHAFERLNQAVYTADPTEVEISVAEPTATQTGVPDGVVDYSAEYGAQSEVAEPPAREQIPQQESPASGAKRPLAIIAGGVMLLALLAGGAWLLLSGQDEAPAVEKRAAPVTQQQVETAASEAERTLRRMKGLARSVRIWMIQYGAGFDPEQVTMQRMQQDLAIKPAEMNDAWGRPLGYQPEGSEFSILSAGADGQFGNSDDLRLTEKARK